jgi:hypothetical protein
VQQPLGNNWRRPHTHKLEDVKVSFSSSSSGLSSFTLLLLLVRDLLGLLLDTVLSAEAQIANMWS